MEPEFGLKELEQVVIKTTQPIEVNGYQFVEGETVAAFDKIQLANFNEQKSFISAKGGFGNRSWVWWENTKEVRLNFVQGIFSRTQYAVLNNAQILERDSDVPLLIDCREEKESDENGIVVFSHVPCVPLFIYDVQTGSKITEYTVIDEKTIRLSTPYQGVLLDYPWEYTGGFSTFIVGRQLTNGTFVLTARTKVKDDITGQVRSCILKIPKLKLMSSLSMALGKNANPVVGRMDASAIPVGYRGQQVVMGLQFLNDDIDADF